MAAHSNSFPEPSVAEHGHANALNRPFSQEEVFRALKSLKNGKAAGTDGLPAELLKKAFFPDPDQPHKFTDPHLLLPEVTQVMNLVFGGAYPQDWAISALTAIPKPKGDPKNMDDYRGIAVGNAMARLYSTLLLQRMDSWAETHERRAKGQAGFRRDRSTVDNIFVLQHAIERARSCKKVVYCAFVNFQKAYDSVNRDLLWHALQGLGVHGAFLRSLQCMYANVGMRVKLEGRLGRIFAAPLGVRQGDPLSPLLFGLYIDRFEQFVLQECPLLGIELTDTQIVSLLLYADDLVLMAQSPEDLQVLLDVLHRFAVANHLTVNTQKTKVLACGAPNWRGHVSYGGRALPTVDDFVYLGVRFYSCHHRQGTARLNMQSNLSKAKQALGALRSRSREIGMYNVSVLTRLFDSLVRSVLDYGCEVWGVYQLHDVSKKAWGANNACEELQRTFLRCCFGVRSQTPVAIMMSEARRQPLARSWCQRAIGWWNKIVQRDQDDLALIALRDSVTTLAGSVAGKPVRCWALAFRNMIHCIAPDCIALVDSLDLIPVETVLSAYDEHWSAHTWGDWRTLTHDAQPLRDIPPARTTGFKLATYRHLFCTDTIEKGFGFVDHVHTPAQIKALASF
ncbi:MAG: RNA-directed DNA polymerase, partial [bacterium]